MHPEVVDVLRRVGGWSTASDLVAVCGRPAVDRAVRAGLVLRIARGRYALAGLPDPWTSAARVGGVVSHASAARYWGLAVLSRADETHLTVARTRSRVMRAGARIHWVDLAPHDVDPRQPVTVALRTVLDCARTLPFGEALAVADSALRARLVGREEMQRASAQLRGPGAGRARRVARSADGRAESGLESVLRGIFVGAGVRTFVPQYLIEDIDFSARVDLADPRRRLVAEADSFEHHGHRAALVRDCERYDELLVRGWRLLRFAWEHVMFRPEWVAAIIRTAASQPPPNMRETA